MIFRGSFYTLLITTLLLGVMAYNVSNIPQQQMEQGKWVTHTHQVISQIDSLTKELSGALSTQSNLERAADAMHKTADDIKSMTKDNPTQQARIEQLHQAISTWFANPAQSVTNDTTLKEHIEVMRNEEERLLQEREMRWQDTMSRSRLLFLCIVGLVYLLILFTYGASKREAKIREQLLDIETEAASAQRNIAARMTQIVEIQQDIIYQRMNLQNAMEVITRRTQQITRADGAVIEMLEDGEMVYKAVSGTMEPFLNMRIKAKGSLSGLCIESANALRCDDSEADERVDKVACRKVGLRSMIVVPLIHNSETVGVLKVTSSKLRGFSTEDMHSLQLMAGVLSATLRDASASEALQDTNRSLNMSNELLKQQKTQLESDKLKWKDRADTDEMTGLKNHRFFQECLAQEYARAKRYGDALSLILCDIDHFKQINDRYGHPAGDSIIKQVADILGNSARPSDCVARYGGEEFAIILTQTPLDGAVAIANRICDTIRKAAWPHGPVTVSIGISDLKSGAINAPALVEQADKALYQSKAEGRDRIMVFAG